MSIQTTTLATQRDRQKGLPSQAQIIDIKVDKCYSPDLVQVAAGRRIRLRFISATGAGPLSTVVLPTLQRKIKLYQDRPVMVDLGALPPGVYPFTCELDHCCGWLVVTS